jgi:hypothetical protein
MRKLPIAQFDFWNKGLPFEVSKKYIWHFCLSVSLAALPMEQGQADSNPSPGVPCANGRPGIDCDISAISAHPREIHCQSPIEDTAFRSVSREIPGNYASKPPLVSQLTLSLIYTPSLFFRNCSLSSLLSQASFGLFDINLVRE